MVIDTHTHLYFDRFDEDRDQLIRSLEDNGVEKVISIGTDIENCRETIRLAEQYDIVYGTVGFHPTDLDKVKWEDLKEIRGMLTHPKIVGVGEVGMDFYWDNVSRDKQRKYFIRQLEIALEDGYPLSIHNRDADEATMEILREVNSSYRGVFHCFAGDMKMAEELLDMGFYISFTGNITFKKSDRGEIIEKLPLEKILLETDAPFLTPVPFRGKRNEPKYVKYVAEKIAEIKGITFDEVARVTTQSAKDLFKF